VGWERTAWERTGCYRAGWDGGAGHA
jgi:hypothetical protein